MAKASRYAYTSFAAADAVYLEVFPDADSEDGGVKFQVASVTTSFPINGIPQATVMIAIGRDARNQSERAKVHDNAALLRQMKVAKVYLKLLGQHRPDDAWPEGSNLLFDGYLSGFSYKKLNGKVYANLHINHWLIDMTMSSILASQIHPRSSTDLRSYAVQPSSQLPGAGAGGGAPNSFISSYRWFTDLKGKIPADLWDAMKFLLAAIAGLGMLSSEFEKDAELAGQDFDVNDRAIKALERIEGPEYEFGNAIKLTSVEQPLVDTIAAVLGSESINTIRHNTMWDMMVGTLLPMFGLELWPMIDKAVVVPSLPAFKDSNWREISSREYVAISSEVAIPKPVRGVMVYGNIATDTFYPNTTNPAAAANGLAGFAGHGKEGAVILISPPGWLSQIPVTSGLAVETTRINDDGTLNTATQKQDDAPKKPENAATESTLETMTDIMHRYADMVYVQSVLRGRTGTLTGRLRFDIGPGSHIKILGNPEKFLGGEDELGGDIFAQVNRVTCSINADGGSPSASTSFGLSYLRTQEENDDKATSLEQPPYYDKESMTQGVPLSSALETDAKEDGGGGDGGGGGGGLDPNTGANDFTDVTGTAFA